MNDSNVIHETVLKDVLDMYDNIKDFVNTARGNGSSNNNPLKGMSSISSASSNMTLVFPVICSRGIAIENSSMISKAIEKNAVSMLQRLLAAYNITSDKNVVDYISNFHNNISSGVASLDDIYKFLGESSKILTTTESNAIRNDMRNINYYLPTSINENALTRYKVQEGAAFDDDDENHRKKSNTNNPLIDKLEINKKSEDFFTKQVLDSEFKKANELMPTSMAVNFKVVSDNGQIQNYGNAIMAVKAKLYPISSNDIITHIADKTTSRNWITNFFRATTREISFVKDFVLAIDKAKIDAMSLSSKKGTSDKMWKVLERRATNSRLNKFMHSNNGAAAITTLCISQEEVEYLRKNFNIDMERISNVVGLFNSLNLMCICIVDETLEVAKFIYDESDPMWETISFNHLERESNDNTYKKVINLMTKMSN